MLPSTASLTRACLSAFLLALFPSLLWMSAALWLASRLGMGAAMPLSKLDLLANVERILLAPVLETMLLAAVVALCRLRIQSAIGVAFLAAILFGALHGVLAPLRFAGAAWSFFVFALMYQQWRPRSLKAGLLAAAVPHAMVNLTVTLLLLASRGYF